MLAFLFLVLVANSNVLFAQPMRPASVKPRTSEVYSNKATLADVEKAILSVASRLDWMTKKGEDGEIQAKLIVRTHELVVTITFSSSEYTITYKDSKDLKYNASNQTVHGKARKWLDDLDHGIQKELAR